MRLTFRPRLMEATTAAERMDALCEFIEFWNGPRRPEYGIPAEELDTRPLPMPLRRLYEFAGHWPDREGWRGEFTVTSLSCEDSLLSFSKLGSTPDGKLVFVDENQGCWNCRTLTEGDDPPVWCYGEYVDAAGNWAVGEYFVCDSLSRFLTTFVLQGLMQSSRFEVSDDGLIARFQAERDRVIPVWTDGPYAGGRLYEFHRWGEVLSCGSVGREPSSLAANHPVGIAFLESNQGTICRISLIVELVWGLEVRKDGSARVSLSRSPGALAAVTPQGTFSFSEVTSRLTAALGGDGDVRVAFFREGQHGGAVAVCQSVGDAMLVTELYRRALDRCGDPTLDQRFRESWPL